MEGDTLFLLPSYLSNKHFLQLKFSKFSPHLPYELSPALVPLYLLHSLIIFVLFPISRRSSGEKKLFKFNIIFLFSELL